MTSLPNPRSIGWQNESFSIILSRERKHPLSVHIYMYLHSTSLRRNLFNNQSWIAIFVGPTILKLVALTCWARPKLCHRYIEPSWIFILQHIFSPSLKRSPLFAQTDETKTLKPILCLEPILLINSHKREKKRQTVYINVKCFKHFILCPNRNLFVTVNCKVKVLM